MSSRGVNERPCIKGVRPATLSIEPPGTIDDHRVHFGDLSMNRGQGEDSRRMSQDCCTPNSLARKTAERLSSPSLETDRHLVPAPHHHLRPRSIPRNLRIQPPARHPIHIHIAQSIHVSILLRRPEIGFRFGQPHEPRCFRAGHAEFADYRNRAGEEEEEGD